MTYKNTLISLILIAGVGFAMWATLFFYRPQEATHPQTAMLPDALMEDVHAVILDKQGKPSMKIATPKLVHYPENDTSHLTSPELTLYRKSPKPWFVTAKYAEATQGIENVVFRENVVLHHAADENNPATLIKTASLLVQPNKKLADTADLITLTQPSTVIQAVGMHADMNTGNIKLLSQARGEYVPNS